MKLSDLFTGAFAKKALNAAFGIATIQTTLDEKLMRELEAPKAPVKQTTMAPR
jgi:hypothetical protein